MAHPPRFALAAVFFITGCLIATPAAAQKKKSASAAKTAASKNRSQKQTASRSSAPRRGKKGRRAAPSRSADERYLVVPTGPPVPDQIQVVEYGSAKPDQESLAAARPLSRATPDPATPSSNLNPSIKRIDVNIDSARVIEIQQALAKSGFYNGELTGVYDEATITAMRQYQASNQIDVTGYPTAHALKKLGLTSW